VPAASDCVRLRPTAPQATTAAHIAGPRTRSGAAADVSRQTVNALETRRK